MNEIEEETHRDGMMSPDKQHWGWAGWGGGGREETGSILTAEQIQLNTNREKSGH